MLAATKEIPGKVNAEMVETMNGGKHTFTSVDNRILVIWIANP